MMWVKVALVASVAVVACVQTGLCAPANDVPEASWQSGVTSEAELREAVAASPSDALEGVWSTTADGATIGVVSGNVPGASRSFSETLLLVVLHSPRPAVAPGTVMGWCTPAAKAGYYNARIFTRCDGMTLSAAKPFTLHLTDDAHLSFVLVRNGLEFVPWKMIPYMFRSMVRERHDRGRDLDGMLRLWPADAAPPHKPRYL